MINWLKNKILNVPIYLIISFIFFSLLFILIPQIDIFVAKLFYNSESFYSFPFYKTPLEQFLYHSVKPIIIVFTLTSILIYLFNRVTFKNIFNLNTKAIIFIILTVSIAPGLIVNALLKENWGRPRPAQIKQLGGSMDFSPAFIPTKQDGYSFSSGHTAAAFSLIGFALLAKKRKKLYLNLAFTYGAIISLTRMAVGGHFLSDVVTSFFIVYITTLILFGLLIKGKG
jgi:lipid A 4'-phosphatase